MKKSILILAVLLCSCGPTKEEISRYNSSLIQTATERTSSELTVYTVDGCEYVVWDGYPAGGIVHKANCKNHTP